MAIRVRLWGVVPVPWRVVISVVAFQILLACAETKTKEGGQNGRLIWSVNAGGSEHFDAHGFSYQADMLQTGIVSHYGRDRFLTIGRAHPDDAILYQTERYSHQTFGYDIPIKEDGDYVLVLKFCEVYFTQPNMKVFDVTLNRKHVIVEQLDIFLEVGHGNAHDEIIPFTVVGNGKHLIVNGEKSIISKNKIPVEFVKGERDNPKVNAIVLWKGDVSEIPRLPPLTVEKDEIDYDEDAIDIDSAENFDSAEAIEDIPVRVRRRVNRPSPRLFKDPYEDEDLTRYLLPLAISLVVSIIGCFAFRGLTKSTTTSSG